MRKRRQGPFGQRKTIPGGRRSVPSCEERVWMNSLSYSTYSGERWVWWGLGQRGQILSKSLEIEFPSICFGTRSRQEWPGGLRWMVGEEIPPSRDASNTTSIMFRTGRSFLIWGFYWWPSGEVSSANWPTSYKVTWPCPHLRQAGWSVDVMNWSISISIQGWRTRLWQDDDKEWKNWSYYNPLDIPSSKHIPFLPDLCDLLRWRFPIYPHCEGLCIRIFQKSTQP